MIARLLASFRRRHGHVHYACQFSPGRRWRLAVTLPRLIDTTPASARVCTAIHPPVPRAPASRRADRNPHADTQTP